ncbi:MAG: TRAP transporter large permease [Eubacteriales bacterium]|jgi:tripartite ATP-independent transporter DctM subunit
MSAILVITAFLVLFVIGCPMVLAVSLPSIVYVLMNNNPIDVISNRYLYALDSFTFMAIPIFIFAGNLMNTAGITERLFSFADTLVGRIPGGLAQVNIIASLIFSGMSGAALADVGGLGQIEIKAMTEKGFPKPYSAAVTIATSTVGPIFPPSIPLVLFGAVTGTSIIKLLMAGVIPAFIAVIAMMVLTYYLAIKRGFPRKDRFPTGGELWHDFVPAFPALMAPVLLILGMLSGFFTPTEAAAMVVLYMLIVGIFVYHELTFKFILQAALVTLQQTASICLVVAVASLFGWIMTIEKVPTLFETAMGPFIENKVALLIIINLLMFIVGMFFDSNTATLIIVPIIMPTLTAAGIDPVHVGIIIIFNLMIGLLTPPMGLSLLMVSNITQVPVGSVFKETLWYLIPLVGTLAIITFIPQVSLLIPNMI